MVSRKLAIPAFVILVSLYGSPTPASIGPGEQVRITVDAVIQTIKDTSLDHAARKERLSSMIRKRFDFRAMSQSTLGTNWKKASPEEKEKFVALFSDLLEASYIGRIEAYTNERVDYLKEKIENDRAEIETAIVTQSADIPVRYKMVRRGDEWKVYDVVIEEVSLIRNYRSSYREIVKKEGFPGLLARMEEKIKELNNPEKPREAE